MPEIRSVQDLLQAAAPILHAARGDPARMEQLCKDPVRVLTEAGLTVPSAARDTLPLIFKQVLSVPAKASPAGPELMIATMGANTALRGQLSIEPGLQDSLLACSQRVQERLKAEGTSDFPVPLKPRTVLSAPGARRSAPAGSDVQTASGADGLAVSTSGEVIPGEAEYSRIRGLLAALRAGYEVFDAATALRLEEDSAALIKAIEAVDQPQLNPRQAVPWGTAVNLLTRDMMSLLAKARKGDFLASPEQAAEFLDLKVTQAIRALYEARGKVWARPDVELSVHWHGMVLRLSTERVKALADGLTTAASITGELSEKAPTGDVAAVLEVVQWVLGLYAKVLTVVDRGNGVYLTCCWWSLPPLMLPPPPFFPTPV